MLIRTPVSTHRSPNTTNLYTIILFKSCPISFGIEDGKSRKEVGKEVTVQLPGSPVAEPDSGEFTGGRTDTELLGKASASDGQPVLEKINLDHWLFKMSSEYTGSAIADILQTSERLNPEKMNQTRVLTAELVKDVSD